MLNELTVVESEPKIGQLLHEVIFQTGLLLILLLGIRVKNN